MKKSSFPLVLIMAVSTSLSAPFGRNASDACLQSPPSLERLSLAERLLADTPGDDPNMESFTPQARPVHRGPGGTGSRRLAVGRGELSPKKLDFFDTPGRDDA